MHEHDGHERDVDRAGPEALAPLVSSFLGNRAAARMMLQQYEDALSDCLKAIALSPEFLKARIRAVKCCTQLGRLADAKQLLVDFEQPDASTAQEVLVVVQLLLGTMSHPHVYSCNGWSASSRRC